MKPCIAFIGLGVMGQRMLANMTAHGGFNLLQAWDPCHDFYDVLKKTYPDIRFRETSGSVISNKEVDVVYIASPPQSHREHILAAAAANKIIFCEKPLGINIDESKELVEIVEAAGVANAINFPFVGSTAVNFIKKELQNESLGTIKGIDLKLHFSSWPRSWQSSAKWLRYREEGGFIREVVSHFVFLVEMLFGPATLIDKSIIYPEGNTLCETRFHAQLNCQKINISFLGSSGGVGPDQIEFVVWGSKLSYRLWDWYNLQSTTGQAWKNELMELNDPIAKSQNINFINIFQTKKTPEANII